MQALDGLVAIGGAEAVEALSIARTIMSSERGAITVDWIDEALTQMRETQCGKLARVREPSDHG